MHIALRLAAMCMFVAGAALVVAGLASGSAAAAQAAAAFLFAGAGAWYVLRAPGSCASSDLSSRMITLGVVSIGLWMCVRLQPWVALWRDILETFAGLDVWLLVQQRRDVFGLVFAPGAAVIAVPTLQAMSAASIMIGSIAAVALLIVRSPWFARVLLACALMQGAFVLASVSGTTVAERGALSVSVAIHGTRTREHLLEQNVLEQVERYRLVTAATTTTLVWTWAASGLLTLLTVRSTPRSPSRRFDSSDVMPS